VTVCAIFFFARYKVQNTAHGRHSHELMQFIKFLRRKISVEENKNFVP